MAKNLTAAAIAKTLDAGTAVRVLVEQGRGGLVPARRLTGIETVAVTGYSVEMFEGTGFYGRRSRLYVLHTSAGDIRVNPSETLWAAPETPAAVKRAHVEALAENTERAAAAEVARGEARAVKLDAAAVVAGCDDVVTAVAADTTEYGDAVRVAVAEIAEDDRFDLTDAGRAVLAEADAEAARFVGPTSDAIKAAYIEHAPHLAHPEVLADWKTAEPRRTTDADGTKWVSHPAPPAEAVGVGQVWIPGLPVLIKVDTDPATVAPRERPAPPAVLDALPLTGPAWSMLAAPGLPSDLTPRDADVTPSGRLRSWVDALAWAVQRRLPVDMRDRGDISDAKLDDYVVDRVAAYVADRGGYGLDDRLAALRQVNDAADVEAAEWVRMIEEAGNRAN